MKLTPKAVSKAMKALRVLESTEEMATDHRRKKKGSPLLRSRAFVKRWLHGGPDYIKAMRLDQELEWLHEVVELARLEEQRKKKAQTKENE